MKIIFISLLICSQTIVGQSVKSEMDTIRLDSLTFSSFLNKEYSSPKKIKSKASINLIGSSPVFYSKINVPKTFKKLFGIQLFFNSQKEMKNCKDGFYVEFNISYKVDNKMIGLLKDKIYYVPNILNKSIQFPIFRNQLENSKDDYFIKLKFIPSENCAESRFNIKTVNLKRKHGFTLLENNGIIREALPNEKIVFIFDYKLFYE